MMDRRQFLLRSLLTTTGAALVPPSQLWPFRKIFLPPVVPDSMMNCVPMYTVADVPFDVLLEWDAASGVYVIKGDRINALYQTMVVGLRDTTLARRYGGR